MVQTTRTERRKRGPLGWMFLLAFVVYNGFMAFALLSGLAETAQTAQALTSDAERAGAAIGTAIGAGFLLFIWVCGAIILGMFTWLTAGRKIIVETRDE